MKKHSVKIVAADAAKCAVTVALMIAGTYIKIPFPVMPLTFQTVFAVAAGCMLGPKLGALSMLAYALLGLTGLPVFTGGGGIYYVLKPSFGYILGFIASAALAGLARKRSNSFVVYMVYTVAATLVDYLFGIAYFIGVWQISGFAKLWESVFLYNVVYLPKDLALAVLAALVLKSVMPYLSASGKKRRLGVQSRKTV